MTSIFSMPYVSSLMATGVGNRLIIADDLTSRPYIILYYIHDIAYTLSETIPAEYPL